MIPPDTAGSSGEKDGSRRRPSSNTATPPPEQRAIQEVNTSIYVFRRGLLAPALRRVAPENSQGEYYLTDVIEVLSEAGYQIGDVVAEDASEIAGVNDRVQLASAEAEIRRRTNGRLLQAGVTMLDPANTYVDTTVEIGTDVTLFPGTILQGDTSIGDGSEVGPNTRLVDCTIGSQCIIENATGRRATVGNGAHVGPYAVLSPGSEVGEDEITGAFYTAG